MRVLVTGATGAAGRAILRRLLARGFGPLFGTFRSEPPPAFLAEFGEPLAAGHLSLLGLDLAELAPDQGPDVEAVIHCAARRPASRCASDPAAAFRDNVEAVQRLVDWSRHRGVELFVHFSIHSLYAGSEGPFREGDPVRAIGPQAEAKLESEEIVACGLGAHVPHIILRLPHFYGADLPWDGVLAAFARTARAGELRVQGDGKQTVCFIELRDLADLIATLLAAPPPSGVYNAASETLGVESLAGSFQEAWRALGRPEPVLRIEGGQQPSSFGLDCTKLFTATPWRPKHLIGESLRGII